MTIAAAALALARELPDTPYRLAPLDYNALARLSLWVEGRASAGLARTMAAGDAERVDVLAAHGLNVAAGEFEPGGGAFQRATRTDAGGRKILALMLVPPEKAPAGWAEAESWAVFKDPALHDRAMALAAEINADPLAVSLRRTPTP